MSNKITVNNMTVSIEQDNDTTYGQQWLASISHGGQEYTAVARNDVDQGMIASPFINEDGDPYPDETVGESARRAVIEWASSGVDACDN